MGGLMTLVLMQTRQVKSIEQRFSHQATHYLTPVDNEWMRKLGAAATIGTEPSTPASAFSSVYVNFQQPSDLSPGSFEGHAYVADRGYVFANRGNGYSYGWNLDNTGTTRNRDHADSPDERYDTLSHMQKYDQLTWEIAVPEGVYTVHVVAGDPGYTDSTYRIEVEGVLAVDATPSWPRRWWEASVSVLVTDGRLTIGNAAGSYNNKLCFLHVVAHSTPNDLQLLGLDRPLNEETAAAEVALEAGSP